MSSVKILKIDINMLTIAENQVATYIKMGYHIASHVISGNYHYFTMIRKDDSK